MTSCCAPSNPIDEHRVGQPILVGAALCTWQLNAVAPQSSRSSSFLHILLSTPVNASPQDPSRPGAAVPNPILALLAIPLAGSKTHRDHGHLMAAAAQTLVVLADLCRLGTAGRLYCLTQRFSCCTSTSQCRPTGGPQADDQAVGMDGPLTLVRCSPHQTLCREEGSCDTAGPGFRGFSCDPS